MKKYTFLIIIAIIILIIVFNSYQKKLRDAKKRTDIDRSAETKTNTLPNADPSKPPITVVVPPTANYNTATFKIGQDVYAGEALNLWLNPNFTDMQSVVKTGEKIGVWLKPEIGSYKLSRKIYAYNYLFPVGPLYIELAPVHVFVGKNKKVYVK